MPFRPIIERMNLLTRKKQDVSTLIRLALKEGVLVVDNNHNCKGRGIYLPKNREDILKVFQKGMLRRYCQNCDFKALLQEVLTYAE